MSNIHPSAVVDPRAKIGDNVQVGPFCVVGPDVVIGAGTQLKSHVSMEGWTTVGSGCTIYPFASIGASPQDLKYKGAKSFVVVGNNTVIRECVTINSGTEENEVTRVGDNCLLMAYSHIAHKCQVGNGVIMANSVQLAGHVIVEDMASIGGLTGVHQFVRIGRMAFVGRMSRISQDVLPFMLVEGSPPVCHGPNSVGLKRRNIPDEVRDTLKKAYRIICRDGLATPEALARIRAELPSSPELDCLVHFVEQSERGVVR